MLARRPDRRTRRALLHLQYSCASPCGPAMQIVMPTEFRGVLGDQTVASLLRSHPAVVRDVEDDSVRIAEFLLVVERLLLEWQLLEESTARLFDRLLLFGEIVDPEADMVDALRILVHACPFISLVLEERQRDRAVRQVESVSQR